MEIICSYKFYNGTFNKQKKLNGHFVWKIYSYACKALFLLQLGNLTYDKSQVEELIVVYKFLS